jgi:hypothetical protein
MNAMEESAEVRTNESTARSRWRWYQFSFATLLKVVAIAAVLAAWWADRARLTERMASLEEEHNTLRLAAWDEPLEEPMVTPTGYGPYPVLPASAVLAPAPTVYPGANIGANIAGTPGAPLPPQAQPYPTTQAYGTQSGPAAWAPSPPRASSNAAAFPHLDLYTLLDQHRDWLRQNFREDQGWQEFLTRYQATYEAEQRAQAARPVPLSEGPPDLSPPPSWPPGADAPLEAPAPQPPQPPESTQVARGGPAQWPTQAIRDQCLPAVTKLLRAGGVQQRTDAAVYLRWIGQAAAPFAAALTEAVGDDDPLVRNTALDALAQLGPLAKGAIPRLQQLLDDPQPKTSTVHVAYALLRIDPQADIAERLVDSLRETNAETRSYAFMVLAELGPERAAAALPALAGIVRQADVEMRISAASLYSRLAQRSDAIAMLKAALREEKDPQVQRHLARTIVRLQNSHTAR